MSKMICPTLEVFPWLEDIHIIDFWDLLSPFLPSAEKYSSLIEGIPFVPRPNYNSQYIFFRTFVVLAHAISRNSYRYQLSSSMHNHQNRSRESKQKWTNTALDDFYWDLLMCITQYHVISPFFGYCWIVYPHSRSQDACDFLLRHHELWKKKAGSEAPAGRESIGCSSSVEVFRSQGLVSHGALRLL